MRLFHIAPAAALSIDGTEEYKPATFNEEGFIHCSYESQVLEVANRLFRGRSDLVLLEIDRQRLTCPVVDENLEGGQELYPHIYGALPRHTVVRIHPFPCGDDGRFVMPAEKSASPARAQPGGR